MTEEINPDPKKIGVLAQKVVSILVDEDSVSRQRAIQAAMMLLGESGVLAVDHALNAANGAQDSHDHEALASFFNRESDLKPSDHAFLCAAYHFSIYGTAAFSLNELREIANDAGVVLPDRLDMTLRNAAKDGKRLFQNAGRGLVRPTAAAGVFFRERWSVKPGRFSKTAVGVREGGAADAET
jgi:hypothetical protein